MKKSLFSRLYSDFLRNQTTRLFWAVISMIIVSICSAIHAFLIKPALDDIFFKLNKEMLIIIPSAMVIIGVIKAVATYFQNFLMKFVGQRIITDMQARLYAHLIYADLSYLQQFSTGKIISRFSNDITIMRTSFSNVLTGVAKEFLTVVALLGVMITLNWQLSILVFIVFPLAIYPIIRMGKKMRKISIGTQEKLGSYTIQLDETFKAIKEVKAFNAEEYEISKSNNILDNIFALYVRAIKTEVLPSPIIEIITSISVACVIAYGGYEVISGNTSPGSFIAFIGAFVTAYRPIKSLAELNNNFQEGVAAASRLYEVLDVEPNIFNSKDSKKVKFKNAEIEFKNVDFSYNKTKLFENLSFKIGKGKVAAFVGSSGSGKTTIASLLMRFYDINSGEILIDDHDLSKINIDSLRRQITMVGQEVLLFDDTVAMNIAYGNKKASRDEIIEAARASAADEFISKLPMGYDTVIGQNGFKLSGGQKQRLSIARAILKDSPIIIFDEATSALDNISEAQIQNSINNLKQQGRTVIIIAHRLSSIIDSDIIYVLDQGKIVASGNHQQLIDESSFYRKLYQKSSKSK